VRAPAFPLDARARIIGRDMRYLVVLALTVVALGGPAAACKDGGDDGATPEGPTTVTLEKTVERTDEADVFAFTLTLSNEGDETALNVTTSDAWERGLEIVEIDPVDGQQPKSIADFGLEFILEELAAGESVAATYRARCVASGSWDNVAVTTATNADAAQDSVGVACP
jgi:uncharacterized repeat protein (TIGR01451 family)